MITLLACALSFTPDPGPAGAVFPHPEGYDAAALHGGDALTSGAACGQCHGITPTATPCAECHADYPHAEGWSAGATHGAAYTAEPGRCTACHGTAGDGLDGAGDCVSCHATYPHPARWGVGRTHGGAVLARGGDAACATCHGADGTRVAEATCTGCHAAYPHGDTWLTAHGAAWQADPRRQACAGCHGDGDTRRTACGSCHDLVPHPIGFRTTHAATTQARGPATCLVCHADGDQLGPTLPVSCAPACHAGGA